MRQKGNGRQSKITKKNIFFEKTQLPLSAFKNILFTTSLIIKEEISFKKIFYSSDNKYFNRGSCVFTLLLRKDLFVIFRLASVSFLTQ